MSKLVIQVSDNFLLIFEFDGFDHAWSYFIFVTIIKSISIESINFYWFIPSVSNFQLFRTFKIKFDCKGGDQDSFTMDCGIKKHGGITFLGTENSDFLGLQIFADRNVFILCVDVNVRSTTQISPKFYSQYFWKNLIMTKQTRFFE